MVNKTRQHDNDLRAFSAKLGRLGSSLMRIGVNKVPKRSRTILVEASDDPDDDFGSFIGTLLPGIEFRDWSNMETALLSGSPILGPYVVEGMRKKDAIELDSLLVVFPDNRVPMRANDIIEMHCPWDVILQHVSIPIAVACAAGATKVFVDLLRAWVEERKGRAIRIRSENCEIELKGGVSAKSVQRAVALFEKHFGKSRIITP